MLAASQLTQTVQLGLPALLLWCVATQRSGWQTAAGDAQRSAHPAESAVH
jgi:hypothetical protein